MPTLHESLISKAAAVKADKAAPVKTASSSPMEVDAAGVEKLAAALSGMPVQNQGLRNILAKTAQVLRTLSAQNEFLVNDLASRMQNDEAAKVAQDLVKREIITQDQVAEMTEKVAKLKSLDSVKEALEIVHRPVKKDLPLGTIEKSASRGGQNDSAAEAWIKKDPAAQYLLEQAGLS